MCSLSCVSEEKMYSNSLVSNKTLTAIVFQHIELFKVLRTILLLFKNNVLIRIAQ